MKWVLAALLLLIAAAQLWVRLAPSDPARWHAVPTADGDRDFKAGAIRVIPATAEDFARLDAIIRATPRTSVLAGSREEGRITYVTRSAFWGFPDYTTVDFDGSRMRIFGRLRFGRSDLGVNRARIEGWLAALRAGE